MSDPRTFSWHKRPGWVLSSIAWNKAGEVVHRMWKPPLSRAEKAALAPPVPVTRRKAEPVKRGALAAELHQETLDL